MSNNFVLQTTDAEKQLMPKILQDVGINFTRAHITVMAGDGSDRRFLRIDDSGRSFIIVLPNLVSEFGLAESRAAWFIGRHLESCGIPVPEMYGYDAETGIVIYEDLGDRLLYHHVIENKLSDESLVCLYEPVIELLAYMQIAGKGTFQTEWCWDTAAYDRQLMLDRESGYFIESCCSKFLGIKIMPAGLQSEFNLLAEMASAVPSGFFLHRDFQSRNIMIKDGRHRVIDFQGGRLGPLGYDLASLLIDPYVSLSENVRECLLQKYLAVLADYPEVKGAFSVEGYYLFALQRNLQILGAFAFLANVKGKSFFRAYLVPAAISLHKLLNEPVGLNFPELRAFSAGIPGLLYDAVD